jgi:hypothetical protein
MIELSMVWRDPSFQVPSHLVISSIINISLLINLLIEPNHNQYLKFFNTYVIYILRINEYLLLIIFWFS